MSDEIKVSRGGRQPVLSLGWLWFVGWLFTIGFVHLPVGRALLGLLIWPYYLGSVMR
jgi:hypothetical protein